MLLFFLERFIGLTLALFNCIFFYTYTFFFLPFLGLKLEIILGFFACYCFFGGIFGIFFSFLMLVGGFVLKGPLRQYCSLYWDVSQTNDR